MGYMKRLAGGGSVPRIRTARYGKSFDGFHVDFSMFVDRKTVTERVERKKLRVLARTGGYGMRTMRNSIKSHPTGKAKRTVVVNDVPCFIPPGQGKVLDARSGKPVTTRLAALAVLKFRKQTRNEGIGRPPRRGVTDLLRKRIFFGVEADEENVVIGPEMFAKQPQLFGAVSVPQLLDQGGAEAIRVGGINMIAQYEPRPFVAPALPPTREAMERFLVEIPL